MRGFEAYEKVLRHRRTCPKWGKSFCLECFGGGLTKYTERLLYEIRKHSPIVEQIEEFHGLECDKHKHDCALFCLTCFKQRFNPKGKVSKPFKASR